jgi:hypothetical protein
MTQEPTDHDPQPVAWAVMLADGDRIYDVYAIEEEAKAISESVAGNHGITPLYRSPDCPYVTGTVTRYCTLTPFTLTAEEREAILYCVSCAQDYRDTLDGSEERATQMIETAMRFAMPQVGPAPVEGPRTASVTGVGGAGPTLLGSILQTSANGWIASKKAVKFP